MRQVTGYGLASAVALVVDAGGLWLLAIVLGVPHLLAAALSFLAGAAVAYGLSLRLAFDTHRLADRRAEFVIFVAIGVVALIVNVAALYIMVDHYRMNLLPAKGVAAVCTFACNFGLRRQILFVRGAAV